MRGVASLVAAIALGGVVWAGLSYRASLAQDEPDFSLIHGPIQADAVPLAVTETLVPSDEERRAALNARMQAMIQNGKGARLTDGPAKRPVSRPSASSARSRSDKPANGASSGRVELRRTGYTPPNLDLKTPPQIPGSDLECLTQAIYYEARNESETGQAAVAEVVMNRVRHPSYPKRVCDVVYQRNARTCQFTFTCDGSIGRSAIRPQAWARAERIARDVYEGRSRQLPSHSVNYHANYVRPSWGQRLARVRQIGAHIFYGAPLNGEGTPGAREAESPAGPVFVRNEAIEKAYERLMGQTKGTDES